MRSKLKSKKLTFNEMWQLYIKTHPHLSTTESTLLDELKNILEDTKPKEFVGILQALHINQKLFNSPKLLLAVIESLKLNRFFEYVGFIRGIDG